MNCLLASYAPYQISGDLQSQYMPAGVFHPAPGELNREELLLKKLGSKGWGRVHHFLFYKSGWGDGTGKAISNRALECFYSFIDLADLPENKKPSVFLTDRGGLELCWEDMNEKSVQVEFFQNGIEVYRASNDKEVKLPLTEVQLAVELTL